MLSPAGKRDTVAKFSEVLRHMHLSASIRKKVKINSLLRDPSDMLDARFVGRKKLGKGNFGTVFRARDLKHGNAMVALKQIDLTRVLKREGDKLIRRLRESLLEFTEVVGWQQQGEDHCIPNIICTHDIYFTSEPPAFWIVMELLNDDMNHAYVKQEKKVGEKLLVRWMEQGLGVLSFLRKQNTVHRDIKPQNLLVDGAEDLYFADFGLICFKDACELYGTPAYFSPSAIVRDRFDFADDLYAFGVSLFEAITHVRYVESCKEVSRMQKQYKDKGLSSRDVYDFFRNIHRQKFAASERPAHVGADLWRMLSDMSDPNSRKRKTADHYLGLLSRRRK